MSIIPTTTRPISLDDAPEPAPAYPNRRDMYLLELEQQRAVAGTEGTP